MTDRADEDHIATGFAPSVPPTGRPRVCLAITISRQMSSGSGHWPESLSDPAPQGRVQRSPQTPQLTAGCSRPAPRRHPPDQEANMGRPGRARRKSVRTLPCGQARCGRGVRSGTPCHRLALLAMGLVGKHGLATGGHVRGGLCRAIGWCFTAGRRTPSPRRQPPGWPTGCQAEPNRRAQRTGSSGRAP